MRSPSIFRGVGAWAGAFVFVALVCAAAFPHAAGALVGVHHGAAHLSALSSTLPLLSVVGAVRIATDYGQREITTIDAPAAGKTGYAKLRNSKDNRYLQVVIEGDYQITVDATEILGVGSIVQAFTEFGIDDPSAETEQNIDLMHWLQTTQFFAQQSLSVVRATSVDNADYAAPIRLREVLHIPFSIIFAAKENETYFREKDETAELRAFYTMRADSASGGGINRGGTATLANVTVDIQQYFATLNTSRAPLAKPNWKRFNVIVTGAGEVELKLPLEARDLVRGFSIVQLDNNLGMVNDVISDLRLDGDRKSYIGDGNFLKFDRWARDKQFQSAGDVYDSVKGGAVYHLFQERGLISNCLNPKQDSNFVFRFKVNTSTRAGAAAQQNINVVLHLLRRDPSVRGDAAHITADDATFIAAFAQ